jgi:hypothetical protein
LPGRIELNQIVTGPCCHSCMQCEVVEVSSCQIRTVHSFVTSVLCGSVAWPASRPGRFSSGLHWTGCMVSSRAVLDASEERKPLPLLWARLRILGHPGRSLNTVLQSSSISSSSSYGSRCAFPLFFIHSLLRLAAARQVFVLSDAAPFLRTSYSCLFLRSSAELHFPRYPFRVRFVFLLWNVLTTWPVHCNITHVHYQFSLYTFRTGL